MYDKIQHRQKGLAAVEFVITLPVLLLVMMATAELGRAFYQYNALEKSVRDATRYLSANAIQDGTKLIDISAYIDDVKNLVVYGDRNGGGIPILPGLVTDDVNVVEVASTHVQVSVNFAYQSMLGTNIPTFGLGNGNISSSITFSSSSVMRGL